MFTLKQLPPKADFNKTEILYKTIAAHKALAELKGYSDVLPNKNILINAVTINEAKDSSEIENIITTHDELYKALSTSNASIAAKEVVNYRTALWNGYELINEHGFLSINMIVKIQSIVEQSEAGIRKVPGTILRNERTKETVYTPPVGYDEIIRLMTNLEQYINNDEDQIDDLIKLAVIHYQFESIHPFYDGNGRTGRIINVIYLTLKGLLDTPILYLSSYINNNKADYYRHLQEVRDTDSWDGWVIYMLEGIAETATKTLNIMKSINQLIEEMIEEIKQALPKIYSKELIDVIFYEFYTKISFVVKGVGVTRKTASSYLSQLEDKGFLRSEKFGRERVYVNERLYEMIKKANF